MKTLILGLFAAQWASAQMLHDYVLVDNNSASELQLDAMGGGYYSTASGDTKLKWTPGTTNAEGFFEITLNSPIQFTTFPVVQFNGAGIQIKADYTIAKIAVKVNGAKVTVRSTSTRTFPDNPEVQADPSVPKVESDDTEMNVVSRNSTLKIFSLAAGDRYAFAINFSKILVEFKAGGFDILDGPQEILDEGTFGTYALSTDGKELTIKVGANLTSTYRLLSTTGKTHKFFAKTNLSGKVSVVAGNMFVDDSKNLSIKASDFVGEYKWNDETVYFFNADGTGGFKATDGDIYWMWSIVNGEVEVLRYRKADGTGFTSAAEILKCHSTKKDCVNYGKRVYRLVNTDGQQRYLLRKIYRNDANGKLVEARVDSQILVKQ